MMQPIKRAADLKDVLDYPRAVILIWVNWAIHARKSADVVEGLLALWAEKHSDHPIAAFQVDVSEQSGELWDAFRSWLRKEGQKDDQLTFAGVGSLLFVRHGSVRGSISYPGDMKLPVLLSATSAAFEM
jgi:hypothetical protein